MVLIDRLILSIDDLLGYSEGVPCTEWLREGHQLVDNAAKRPDVCLLSVWLRLHDLWARVQDRANERLHDAGRLGAPPLGQAEVGQLQVEVLVDEDVAWGKVPVDNPLVDVEVSEGSAQLHEDTPHDFLLDSVFLLRLAEDVVAERVAVEELHDDVDVQFVCKGIVVSDDVWMAKVL